MVLIRYIQCPPLIKLISVLFVLFQEADSDPSGEAAQTTQQTLTFYELDLGLNHVVRKYSEPLEEHGNMLIAGHFLNISLTDVAPSKAG